ncbi:MAG: hypothetical protein GWP08_13625 [Nitrospiraceae bacterium]|nr:hypothetical protein [Nitrospiraceae bacterium]
MKRKWACALCLLLFSLGYLTAFVSGIPLLKYYPTPGPSVRRTAQP